MYYIFINQFTLGFVYVVGYSSFALTGSEMQTESERFTVMCLLRQVRVIFILFEEFTVLQHLF